LLIGVIAEESLLPTTIVDSSIVRETATAADVAAAGLLFADLVDDPASVTEILEAYLGSVIAEPASADEAPDAQAPPIAADLAETVSTSESWDGALVTTADIAETVTADEAPSATITPATGTTWNPADFANVTFSNGNLTVTGTTTNSGSRSTVGYSSGKYYAEFTVSTWINSNTGVGLATPTATFGAAPIDTVLVLHSGNIVLNSSNTGSSLAPRTSGDIIGMAVDLTARLIWFRVAPTGNWNGSSTANPATGAGGISISALSGTLFAGAYTGTSGEVITGNFGASAFSGSVPSGFTSGW